MRDLIIVIVGTVLYLGASVTFIASVLLVLRRQEHSWQEGYQEGWETRKVYEREKAAAARAEVLGAVVRIGDDESSRWN